jgi:hypothetical protein
VREKIEFRFRVPSAAVFTLYSYSEVLEYRFKVPTADSLIIADLEGTLPHWHSCQKVALSVSPRRSVA